MKTPDLRRALQNTLRWGDLSFIDAEAIRCIAIVHNNDEVTVRLSTKAFSRHRWRPGRRRNPIQDKRVREAKIWVQFNRKSLGKEVAIKLAAKQFGVTPNSLTNALEGRVRKFNNLKGFQI